MEKLSSVRLSRVIYALFFCVFEYFCCKIYEQEQKRNFCDTKIL